MEVDIKQLIENLQSIIKHGNITEKQEWALIITIAHLEEVLEEEEKNEVK